MQAHGSMDAQVGSPWSEASDQLAQGRRVAEVRKLRFGPLASEFST